MGYSDGVFNTGRTAVGASGGGGSAGVVTLIAMGSQPSTPYVRGSKWFYDGKIYTALTTTTKDSGVDPSYNTAYLYDGVYYYWDGSSLQTKPEDNIVHITGTEIITGNKKFTGITEAVTQHNDDISDKVATTAFVYNHSVKSHEELGVSFNLSSSAGTRILGAASLNFSKSTDVAAGTDDFKGHEIFEGYDILVTYNAETGKAEQFAVEGTYEYETHFGLPGFYSFRMFHIFWYKLEIDDDGNTMVILSAEAKDGYKVSPMHDRNGVLHEWIGISKYSIGEPFRIKLVAFEEQPATYTEGDKWYYNGLIYTATSDNTTDEGVEPDFDSVYNFNGTNYYWNGEDMQTTNNTPFTITTGRPPICSRTIAQFEALPRKKGLRLFGIKEQTSIQYLGLVKYANLDWQATLGNGNTTGYKGDAKAVTDETNVDYVILTATHWNASSQINTVPVNKQCIGVGTASATTWYRIISVEDVTVSISGTDTACKKVYIEGTVSTTANTTVLCLGMELTGGSDNVLGLDGENTGNGDYNASKMPNKTFGLDNFIGNAGQMVGGLAGIGDGTTEHIYFNPDPDGTVSYTKSSIEANWIEVTTNAGGTITNGRFEATRLLGKDMFLFKNGSSNGKTNDNQYYAHVNNTVYRAFSGGTCSLGANAGGFYLLLSSAVSVTHLLHGGRCVFIP